MRAVANVFWMSLWGAVLLTACASPQGLSGASSGNHNDGTLHGGITRTGSGYTFDGHSGYVSVPNAATLNPGAADIAITVGFTLDGNPGAGNDYDLVRKGLAGTKGGDFKVEDPVLLAAILDRFVAGD